ncbi:T9SS type A sorting domain-containing protein [Hymenobacter negativus]|uniref:T9SS type A sorting domain-containing protein n=1 Tax=Hymenobacter negativus TaxID=2795026 RepID=A0ABS0Q3R9_9BACT|nr:T9SS type A sorting domain-containing protein [Hymenobacter negativus]MBH8557013.1 T9SS type A sorting domain-containing protein [Hymenobacter negativus]
MQKSTSLAAVLILGVAAAQAQDLTNIGTQLTVGPGATLTLPGSLSNQAGATLTNNGTVQVAGNLTNAGTIAPGTGSVVMAGSTDQTLTPGGASLANLEVRNTGALGQNRVLLPTNLTVTQQVQLTSGLLRTAPTATLLLPDGATLTGEASGRYVQGNLRVDRANVSGSASVDFGNGFGLNPNSNTLGTVRVTRTAGLQTAGLSYGQNPANASQKGIDRVWTVVSDQQPTTPVDLALAWLPDDDNGLTFGQAQVWRMPDNSAAWQAAAPPASGAARTLTVSTAGLSRFTVSNLANPLPVELLSFTAERQGPDALLRWTTASEKNNDHFEVESSPDGRTFQRIGTVVGQGSSTQRHDYSLPDPNLTRYAAELVYYRLRQVDRDGTFSYSPVRTVQVPATGGFAVQAYPQPFGSELNLLLRTTEAGPVIIVVLDGVGRTVLRHEAALVPGSNTLPLPEAAVLASGVYVCRISHNAFHRTVKIIRE